MTDEAESAARSLTARARDQLGAVAAGLWVIEEHSLRQLAFVAGERLDPEVGRRFAETTRSVPLDVNARLGIVGAAVTGLPTVSRASELPPDMGSGLWLRAFGAERSIAVPVSFPAPLGNSHAKTGLPEGKGVLAVALPAESMIADDAVGQVLTTLNEQVETDAARDDERDSRRN